jgi:hypothetical protein
LSLIVSSFHLNKNKFYEAVTFLEAKAAPWSTDASSVGKKFGLKVGHKAGVGVPLYVAVLRAEVMNSALEESATVLDGEALGKEQSFDVIRWVIFLKLNCGPVYEATLSVS